MLEIRPESGSIRLMAHDKTTPQLFEWAGEMGKLYTDRNPQSVDEFDRVYLKDYGVTRTSMNDEFLRDMPRDLSVLEVGANIGLELEFLRRMGFSKLTGIEINEYAVAQAKKNHPDVNVMHGSGFAIPFPDSSYDFVFTSGVLIHISPADIQDMMREMHRVSGRYIWGFEYYAPEHTEVVYRGNKNLLWKSDFCKMFLDSFPGLRVMKEKKYRMTDGVNISQMYVLEKTRSA